LGRRLKTEGFTTPLAEIEPAHAYDSLHEAKRAIRIAGEQIASDGLPAELLPMTFGIAGYGNVASGVREILAELPTRDIAPTDLESTLTDPSRRCIYQTTFREEHLVDPRTAGGVFDLQDYYDHPDRYTPSFEKYLPYLTVLMNCTYWDERYPRLVTKEQLRTLFATGSEPRLKVIGDLGCDVEGAIECTLKCTEPSDPVYVYLPQTDTIESGVEGNGPVVLAVDILPAELPREASEEFSDALARFLPALARADFNVPFSDLDLPPELLGAVIVHGGKLTPDFVYLDAHLTAAGKG
jgi:alpha-aminoadipic semialdehyde synthase